MAKRVKLQEKAPESTGAYFPAEASIKFVRTGCTLLDCVMGAGWPLGRVVNIVGDKAVGKTLLAIEAAANFAVQYPKGHIWYREAEAAFDVDYAGTLGLPVERVDFGTEGIGTAWDTIESIFADLNACVKQATDSGEPGLYVIDSLDALSSDAEMARDIDKGSFGLEKQKMLGKLFRQLTRDLKRTNICVIFISQVRDKIGVVFGDKHTRTGGKALDFYASIILWLSHLKILTKTIGGTKRATAVLVRAKCKKNKVGLPFRECDFTIRFGYGIEDLLASLEWLGEIGKLAPLTTVKDIPKFLKQLDDATPGEYAETCERVRQLVITNWNEIERDFLPKKRKYAVAEETP
jgi:recombination protein RecA